MAWGDNSSPIRFGGGQTGVTQRELFLDVFGGEVLTAFDFAVKFESKITVKNVGGGQKSWRFPKTWKATSEYHYPGQEMLGNDIDTSEITINIDDILVSHTALSDIDTMLSHFDVRSEFSRQMGSALAKAYDKNIARQLVLAARTAADGPFPAGGSVVDAGLKLSGAIDGKVWIDAIKEASKTMYEKDVPDGQQKYCPVNWDVFEAIKFARDSSFLYNGTSIVEQAGAGQYLLGDKNLRGDQGSGLRGNDEMIVIDDVIVFKTRNTPYGTNESADGDVYKKYRGDWTKTSTVVFTNQAVASVKLMDIGFETERDTRRLEDFMVAKMLTGLGTLRPECAVELKTA